MKRGASIGLLFISVLLISIIAGCGSTSSSLSASKDNAQSASSSSSTSSEKAQNLLEEVTPSITLDKVSCTSEIVDYCGVLGGGCHEHSTDDASIPQYDYTIEISGTATGPVFSYIAATGDVYYYPNINMTYGFPKNYTSEWSGKLTSGAYEYSIREYGDPTTTKWSVSISSFDSGYFVDLPLGTKMVIHAGLRSEGANNEYSKQYNLLMHKDLGHYRYPTDDKGDMAVATPVTITFPCNQ